MVSIGSRSAEKKFTLPFNPVISYYLSLLKYYGNAVYNLFFQSLLP